VDGSPLQHDWSLTRTWYGRCDAFLSGLLRLAWGVRFKSSSMFDVSITLRVRRGELRDSVSSARTPCLPAGVSPHVLGAWAHSQPTCVRVCECRCLTRLWVCLGLLLDVFVWTVGWVALMICLVDGDAAWHWHDGLMTTSPLHRACRRVSTSPACHTAFESIAAPVCHGAFFFFFFFFVFFCPFLPSTSASAPAPCAIIAPVVVLFQCPRRKWQPSTLSHDPCYFPLQPQPQPSWHLQPQ